MAITIEKLDNGNVSFDDGTKSWSYSEVFDCLKDGDFVFLMIGSSGIVKSKLDYNDVTSITTSTGTVNIDNVDTLYTQLITNVFYKTV